MTKTTAKANPANQDSGDQHQGSEPGQEQSEGRHNRQNMGAGLGTRLKAKNQGRTLRTQGTGHTRTEKADSRRTSRR